MFAAGCAQHPPRQADLSSLRRLIVAIEEAPPTTQGEAERLLRQRLALVSETNTTRSYEARDFFVFNIPIAYAEFRDAINQTPPTLIRLHIHGVCLDRSAIVEEYTPSIAPSTTTFHPPLAFSYQRVESWGTLDFTFSETSPECLNSILAWVNRPS